MENKFGKIVQVIGAVVEEVTGVKGEPDGHAVELPPVAAEAGHVHFLRTEKPLQGERHPIFWRRW